MDVRGTTSSTGHFHAKVALDYKQVRKLSNRVFLVDFKGKGAFYAAKIIDLETSSDTDIENEFKGIRFGRMLRHKNLLPVITAFVEKSDLWSITPYCDAPSAGDLCQPTGMDETVIAVIVQDILSGLDYLHGRGIIHRGVKGSHILLRPNEGRCLLTGLNNCISVVEDGKWRSAVHDYPKNARDNLNWLAPEILEQNLLGYNFKSDIYSLGVTCCELANGAIPYANMEATEILLDKLTGNHPKPIDLTCAQFIKLPEGMTLEEKEQYEAYQRRRFTDAFHVFTINLCLNPDPVKRPSASQLLTHAFLKQNKKTSPSSLLSSLTSKPRRVFTSEKSSPPSTYSLNDDYKEILWTFE